MNKTFLPYPRKRLIESIITKFKMHAYQNVMTPLHRVVINAEPPSDVIGNKPAVNQNYQGSAGQ